MAKKKAKKKAAKKQPVVKDANQIAFGMMKKIAGRSEEARKD